MPLSSARRLSAWPWTIGIVAALLLSGVLDPRSANAEVYNLRLLTDSVPDYTDLESFVHSATAAWQTPEEKCIAIWRWGRRSRRQTSCAVEEGRHIWDPILHYNSYGAMNCGVISSLNIACWLQLGYQARYVQLGDHTVSEVSWDQGQNWHLFDSSMSIYCRDHEGNVASCEQIQQADACELSGGVSEPGHFYLYHFAPPCGTHRGPTGWRCAADQPVGYGRTLAAGASSYTDGFSVSRYTQDARFGRRQILNLRPHESYTRYWKPLDDAQNGGDTGTNDPDYFRPLANGSDPDDQHGLNNLRGNGRWLFAPDLSDPNCGAQFYDQQGIAVAARGQSGPRLHPAEIGQSAALVFKISAANAITSMQIEAAGRRGPDDSFRILVSRDTGIHWQPVWQATASGSLQPRVSLRDEVAGVTQCLIKFEMQAARAARDVGLDSLRVTTITQLNRLTLPKLKLGTNRVLLSADRQTDTTVLWPALHAGRYRQTAIQADGVHSDDKPDGMYKATLGAGVKDKPATVTWRIEVPTQITRVTYGAISTNRSARSYVSLQRSWDGELFHEFHRNADGDPPFDEQVIHAADQIPPGVRQAWFRGEFFCTGGEASYNMPGIQDLVLHVEHQPPTAVHFEPIEVTYHWTEHRESGDVDRQHTQLVRALPHEYAINTAGRRDPTMNWVRINQAGHRPDSQEAVYGYYDGEDVGSACESARVSYRWGRQLARGMPYTASRPSSGRSGNPDSDGRELTNGIVIAPTEATANRHVQPASAFWSAGESLTLNLDLQAATTVGGVRVSSHQPNADFCHPARIEVAVSSDGHAWQTAGVIRHDDLWKPPGDYEAWEHDDDPDYALLPAGGRLAYSYPLAFDRPVTARYVRFHCVPLDGCGLGLSELDVYDSVTVSAWPAEIQHRSELGREAPQARSKQPAVASGRREGLKDSHSQRQRKSAP